MRQGQWRRISRQDGTEDIVEEQEVRTRIAGYYTIVDRAIQSAQVDGVPLLSHAYIYKYA
ncbi:MAG: hypothetical protein Q8R28_18145 [Dehalococcoidia bacterium]|nr:hypothetical protein [Dehalococcoidia bacterium]